MQRRPVKMGRARARTGWLLWLAWGIFGSIFLFEDNAGGSLTLSFLLTSPLWCLFAAWPFLWLWRVLQKDSAMVTVDDDIVVGDVKARLVEKDGIRYVEAAPFCEAFQCERPPVAAVTLAGGDEQFLPLEAFRGRQRKTKRSPRGWKRRTVSAVKGRYVGSPQF